MLSILPDAVVTTTARPVTINVLANDTGDALTITSFSKPANGSLVFNADKSFTYTPAGGFVGDDGFSYTVRDGQGTPASIEVTISVLPDDGATVATDDIVEVVAAGDVIIPVLANDMVAGDGSLQISAVSVPGYGAVNVLPDQTIRYVPQSDFVGIDSFNYTATDGQGATATATVTVKVVAESGAPVAVNDAFDVVADTTTVLAILANDSDPNGGSSQIVGFTMPGHGSLVFNAAAKTFSYTPDAGYEGQDQFTYTIRNSRRASASASVMLTVARPMESPAAVNDQVTTEAGQPVTIDVFANDSLPEGQAAGVIAATLPFKGKLAFNPDKTITYTPNPGFAGIDDFTYTIGNGNGDTSKATVTVDVTAATASGNAFDNGYSYRRRLVVPAQQVESTSIVDDVVFLVNEQGDWLRSVANGGRVVSADGLDLSFELVAGGKLDHEIEVYDPVAGRLLAWVRLPNWALSSQFQFLLYYGNASITENEGTSASVWQGYLARWRLPDGSDATGSGRDFVAEGVAAGSLLGDAARFDGSGNLMIADTDWLANLSAITVQALVKPDASMVGTTNGILVQGSPDSNAAPEGIMIRYLADTSTNAANVIHARVGCQDGNAFTLSSANQQTDKRQLIHGTWLAGRAPNLYLDGIKETPSRSVSRSGATSVTGPLYIGAGWQGLVDEVRIAGRALPADWIAVEARNMLTPEFSYGLGHEETIDTVDVPPIAVPLAVSTTSGKRVDIDVLAQAVDPSDAGSLLLTGVSQPLQGIATVVNNAVSYTPNAGFVGTDQFKYTISNGDKSANGWITVSVAAANDSSSPPQTDTGVVLSAAQRTVKVSNQSQLNAAIADATAGDEIELANGNYSGFTISDSGTEAAPIVIRAANILGAVITSTVNVNADNITLYGLDSTRNIVVGQNGRAANFKLWRCRVRNGSGIAVRTYNAPDPDFAYCQIGPEWAGRGFLVSYQNGTRRPVWRYCLFTSTPAGYGPQESGGNGECVHWGDNGAPDGFLNPMNGLMYRCRIYRWNSDTEQPSIKCSGNTIRQCTLEDCTGGSGGGKLNIRFGFNNTVEACWVRNSGGIGVRSGCNTGDNRHKILGNLIESGGQIELKAGNVQPCDTSNSPKPFFNAAGWTVVSGNTGTVRVGEWSSSSQNDTVRAQNIRIRQHSGTITPRFESGTDSQPGVTETLYTWADRVWLDNDDVGPFADL